MVVVTWAPHGTWELVPVTTAYRSGPATGPSSQSIEAVRVFLYAGSMRSRASKAVGAGLAAATIALLVAAVPVSQSPVPDGWPGLWGPSRTGDAAGNVAPIRSLREIWRRPSAGGYSEIAVSGGRAVTLELRGADDFAVAVDASTGRQLWAARIGPTYRGHGGSDDGPISTPAIDGSEVFAIGPHGHLVVLDAATGRERWRHDLVREFAASEPIWGFAASPLVEGNLVIVPTGGEKSRGLLAFDRASGRLVWSAPHVKARAYTSAVAAVLAGRRQVIASAGDRVFAVSPADGSLLWSVPGSGTDVEVANSPLVLPEDRILLTYWRDSVMLKIARQGDTFSASELWRSTIPRGANGPTIHRDGFLYGFAGTQMVCLDARTGRVRWRERTGEGTLVGAGQNLLFLSQSSGYLHVVRATPDAFTEVLRASALTPNVRAVTGPSLAGGRVYLRNLKELAAFALIADR
jgi:outer membrane protein assembly factor BamB